MKGNTEAKGLSRRCCPSMPKRRLRRRGATEAEPEERLAEGGDWRVGVLGGRRFFAVGAECVWIGACRHLADLLQRRLTEKITHFDREFLPLPAPKCGLLRDLFRKPLFCGSTYQFSTVPTVDVIPLA